MPMDDLAQARLERGDVELTPHPDTASDVVGKAPGLETVDKPQPLLRKGERIMVRVVISDCRDRSHSFAFTGRTQPSNGLGLASGELVTQRGGKRALGRTAAEAGAVLDRKLGVQLTEGGNQFCRCQPGRSLHRAQRR